MQRGVNIDSDFANLPSIRAQDPYCRPIPSDWKQDSTSWRRCRHYGSCRWYTRNPASSHRNWYCTRRCVRQPILSLEQGSCVATWLMSCCTFAISRTLVVERLRRHKNWSGSHLLLQRRALPQGTTPLAVHFPDKTTKQDAQKTGEIRKTKNE